MSSALAAAALVTFDLLIVLMVAEGVEPDGAAGLLLLAAVVVFGAPPALEHVLVEVLAHVLVHPALGVVGEAAALARELLTMVLRLALPRVDLGLLKVPVLALPLGPGVAGVVLPLGPVLRLLVLPVGPVRLLVVEALRPVGPVRLLLAGPVAPVLRLLVDFSVDVVACY